MKQPQTNTGDLSQPLLSVGERSAPIQDLSKSSTSTPRKAHRVFEGVSQAKRIVEETLSTKHETSDEYAYGGVWPTVVRSKRFQNTVMLVIVANTIWIGIDTDYNHADSFSDASLVFQSADSFFCAFFLLEIIVRLQAFQTWRKAFVNSSFLFDFSLVLLMIWQTWLDLLFSFFDCQMGGGRTASTLRVLRLFRLTRVARLSRVLSVVPELEVLSKGMIAALRGMLVTLSMLLIIVYVFAILFTQMLAGTSIARGHFENVLQSMNFMLLQVLCGFDASFFNSLAQTGWIYYLMWLALLLVASLVLMNMLIGILVDMVSTIAESEKDSLALLELEAEVEQLDTDGNRTVSQDELGEIIRNPAVTTKLAELGVDVAAFVEFAEFVFQQEDEMEITDFVHMAVQFRGEKHSTVKDVVDLRKFITMEVTHLETQISARLRHGVSLPWVQRNG